MAQVIVVFDHSANHLRLFEAVLTRFGYQVVTYRDHLRSLEQLTGLSPHLIILGYMKGFFQDEILVLRQLRDHPNLASVPVLIATTGNMQFGDANGLDTLQHYALITKPFDVHELIEAVSKALSR